MQQTITTKAMSLKFKGVWDSFSRQLPTVTTLRSKGPLFLLLSLLAGMAAVVVVLFLWTSQGSFRPLYGQQEHFDATQILSILDQEQIPYRLMETSGQVLVEEDRLAQVRMLLAAKGVKAQLPVGLDMLEQESTLGTSQFVENARYRRGLEGELARTIMGLQGVEYARVHLAIPDKVIFLRGNEEQPSASAMLELTPGTQMAIEQVLAVVNLIKGSVSNLSTENISVVDQHGNLLSQDLEEAMSGSGLTVRQLDYQKRVEKGYERRVSEMLQPLLGANNYRVQVTANLSFDTVEETRESLEPTPIVREERLLKDASQGGQLDAVPGALSNRPPVTDANNPTNAAPQQPVTAARAVNERDEQQRRYDVGRTITHTKYQLGRLNNISVSVVLNQAMAPEKGWDEAHLSNVRRMAQDAVGFNQDRGDQFSLNAFPFSENGYTSDGAWWQAPVVLIYARYLVGTILGLSLIFFGIRKLMNYLMLRHQQEAQNQQAHTTNSTSGIGRQPLPQGDHFEPRETNLKFANVRMNELPDTNSPLQEKLAHLQLLADNDPKRVAEVLEQWMNSR